MERNETSGDDVTVEVKKEDVDGVENLISVTEASVLWIDCIVKTKKGFLYCVLNGSEILQEFTKKSVLKQTTQKKRIMDVLAK